MKIIMLVVIVFFYAYSSVSESFHHAFGSWKDYSYFYKRAIYHGTSSMSKEIKNGVVEMWFVNKKGKKCRF